MPKKKIAPDKVALVEEIISLKDQKRLQWRDIYNRFPNDYPTTNSFSYAVKTGKAPFLPELIELLKTLDKEDLKQIHKTQHQRLYCKDSSWATGDRISRVYVVEDHELIMKEEKWV